MARANRYGVLLAYLITNKENVMVVDMKKYIGSKVLWNQDYRDGQPKDIVTIDSICYNGGFDRLNKPVFLNKSKDRYMTLNYVRKYIIINNKENV